MGGLSGPPGPIINGELVRGILGGGRPPENETKLPLKNQIFPYSVVRNNRSAQINVQVGK